ncbi:hypothetical protein VTN02DRAFT_3446 [Thermoascus thermophilus]
MLLLPDPTLAHLLRHLTREQCQRLRTALCETLGAFSAQQPDPDPDPALAAGGRLIHQPLRTHIVTRAGHTSLFMPASTTTSTGIKIVTVPGTSTQTGGTGTGGTGVVGVINVFAPEGRLTGVLGAAEVTAFRTALATMSLLTRWGASLQTPKKKKKKKKNIVIFGAGRQAEWHARLALLFLADGGATEGSINRITFINRGRHRLEVFEREVLTAELRPLYPDVTMAVLARDGTPDFEQRLRAEIAASDVLFCCTSATEPLFPDEYLHPEDGDGDGGDRRQRFIALIGSYTSRMREVDTPTLLSGGGRVYVDSREACLAEAGEIIAAEVRGGQLVEIGELFAPGTGVDAVVVPDGCNVVFKCVGMGIMDLVVGKTLLEIAEEMRIGTRVDGF